jgi:hypothetical protein
MKPREWAVVLSLGVLAATGCKEKDEIPVALHTDARLRTLTVMVNDVEATLSPAFSSDTHVYDLAVPYPTQTVSLMLATSDDLAKDVTVTEFRATIETTSGVRNDTSIPLVPPALNTTATVRIVVTAQDGASFAGYTVRLTSVAPAIQVSQGTTDVAADSTVKVNGAVIGMPAEATFTIANSGSADLAIASVLSSGTEFVVSAPPAKTIAPNASTTFKLMFSPTSAGTKTTQVAIANSATTSFAFTVSAEATASAIPVINVRQGTKEVASGSTVSVAGPAMKASSETAFTIGNAGTAALIISGVTVSGTDFSLSKTPDGTVAAGGTTTFNVKFSPTTAGAKTALVTIANNTGKDFTFTVSAADLPFVHFVKQVNGGDNLKASMADGTITVSSKYSSSGNAFKWVAPNYYGTSSNGFISFPTAVTGDFGISAEVTVTTQNKANNACGIGLGITTGFDPTDAYAYILMRNSSNVANGYYVSGAGAVSPGSPSVELNPSTAVFQLSFSRKGSTLTYGAGKVGSPLTSNSAATSYFTNGTTVYGAGAVYPTISFNNVEATIKNLVVKDENDKVVYDSATGTMVDYVPASLTVPTRLAWVMKGASTSVTVTAKAIGGAVSQVTAVAADSSIVDVSVASGITGSTINLTGRKGGATTVTITNSADANRATNTVALTVVVKDYATSDNYGSLAAAAYPAPGATDAYVEGEMALTFDEVPTLNLGGSIEIHKLSDGTEVDSVGFSGETQTFGTAALNVDNQLVRVGDKTVFFTPHLGKLAYGTAYYVVIPTTSITGTLNGAAFTGLSNLTTVATWKFTTRAAPTPDSADITVDGAQSSTANFRTLQGALDAVASSSAAPRNVTIHVAAGTYRELLRYVGPGPTVNQTLRIVGPSGNAKGDTCVFQYTNGNQMNGSTQTRATFYFAGANLILENVTLRNTGVRSVVNQAETIYFASGAGFTMAAYNSSFQSNQDTIRTSGRTWFYKCFIEGNVDFLWGTAQASLFEDCDLRVVNDRGGAASFSLIVARTGTTIPAGGNGVVGKGYVLYDSRVKVDDDVTLYYGRDAGPGTFYDQVALVNVAFSTSAAGGTGKLGAGLWDIGTAPLALGDASYIGWKAAGCTGLNLPIGTAAGTSANVAQQSTEYDTRSHILNRMVTVMNGEPAGFEAASTTWDVSSLATDWSAP